MATFRADKAYHFSQDGSDPWAKFERVPGTDPAVYEFETTDTKVINRLKKAKGVELVGATKAAGGVTVTASGGAGGGGGEGSGGASTGGEGTSGEGSGEGGSGEGGSGGGASA